MLVLDDLHEVGDGAAIADLDRLLRHPPRALRIVAATRIDPPLRLGRMRLAGDLCDVRERDLAFTEAETGALLHAGGTDLEPDAVRVLWQRTEGWAAGLRMAAIALRTHPDPARFVAAFAGDDVAMADYLLSEVLAQQPPELVDFLLRTSIVSLVSGELATALTGLPDADRLLARLEREHALVAAIGDDRLWHRYHPLLRELLRSELRFRRPAEVPQLHARAARWYAARERPAEALRHAADAGEWEMVARLAGEHWMPLLVSGELGMLRPVLEGLPRERAREDPEVALALAATILDAGDEPGAAAALPPRGAARGAVPGDRAGAVRARARRRRRDPRADARRPRRRRAARRAAARGRRRPRPAHARPAQPRHDATLDRRPRGRGARSRGGPPRRRGRRPRLARARGRRQPRRPRGRHRPAGAGAPPGRRDARARGRARLGADVAGRARRGGAEQRRARAQPARGRARALPPRRRAADPRVRRPAADGDDDAAGPARGRRGPAGAGAGGARARGRAERGLAGDARDARARRRAGGDQPRRARRPRGRRGAAAQRRGRARHRRSRPRRSPACGCWPAIHPAPTPRSPRGSTAPPTPTARPPSSCG